MERYSAFFDVALFHRKWTTVNELQRRNVFVIHTTWPPLAGRVAGIIEEAALPLIDVVLEKREIYCSCIVLRIRLRMLLGPIAFCMRAQSGGLRDKPHQEYFLVSLQFYSAWLGDCLEYYACDYDFQMHIRANRPQTKKFFNGIRSVWA